MGLSGGHLRGGSNFAPLNQDPRCARSQKFRLFRAPMRRTRRNHRNSRNNKKVWRGKKGQNFGGPGQGEGPGLEEGEGSKAGCRGTALRLSRFVFSGALPSVLV